jgi:hypothetical protein
MLPPLTRVIFANPAVAAPAFGGFFGSDVFRFRCHARDKAINVPVLKALIF